MLHGRRGTADLDLPSSPAQRATSTAPGDVRPGQRRAHRQLLGQPAGLAGADCLLSAAIAQPVCAAGTIDPKLTQFANKKLQRALDNVRKAAQATKAKQQQKLIDKAGGLLGKILRRELGTTSDGCLQLLTAQVDEVLDTLPRR